MKLTLLSVFFDLLTGKNVKITKASQLAALQTETFIAGVLLSIVFLGIAFLISNMIAYQGGRTDRSGRKRLVWFLILGVIDIIILFLINTFQIRGSIKKSLQDDHMTTNIISIAICAAVFFIGGFVLSKLMKNSKFGTIFPSKKA